MLFVVFLSEWKSGEANPLEDTEEVLWADRNDIKNLEFTPKTKELLQGSFAKK